ncbi:hypothetical protein B0T26DRAFT_660355 [Lasiosphaeria miniovina]|uniref:Postreplication repair E3 ubiquitin-protein ligase RAD18 n=1 Tax=Lasiosphaeria miniovina TaxID=1954250 RepID=A0AA40DHK3_9PEZI|nr:uncharacterized protein B0T26DRAFT_660355 [Lasiosphaeria miniovina]KAK0701646.1 hypothetical protein B0T26DRAFT_660355 [Lasiosphaeria miniovina]
METFNGEAYDVPDSTDWLNTPLSGLMAVEQAFRCYVCKDFFTSPMLTSCNHTFCSICIRRCLSVDGKCPLCRALDQESKLRGNWALREAVDAFVASRDTILRFARTPAVTAVPRSPKRKAAEVGYTQDENSQDVKRHRTSSRLRSSKARGAEATAEMMRDEVDVPDSSDTADFEPGDGLVACPICWIRMKPMQVDKHLDTACPGPPQSQLQPQHQHQPASASSNRGNHGFRPAGWPSPPPARLPERLPALAYSMLKDGALRKKMSDLGLSTAGPRQILERRHQEWITIWNANCDSARPKKRSELLHDLDVWEKTMGTRAPTTSRAAAVGAQIKDKDFDAAAWAIKHDTSFKDLIANARKTKNEAEQKTRQAAEPDEGKSSREPSQSRAEGETEVAFQQRHNDPSRTASILNLIEPPSSKSETPSLAPEAWEHGYSSGPAEIPVPDTRQEQQPPMLPAHQSLPYLPHLDAVQDYRPPGGG